MKPTDDAPASMRIAFINEAMPATEGDEHEVPLTLYVAPPMMTS